MKKIFFLALSLLAASVLLDLQAQKLKQVMTLKMPKTADDDMCGTRGASVVWHPIQKKYYAAFAGNTGYPLAVFDLKGKLLSDEELTTFADVRGLWYDPITKSIDGNAHSEAGWFSYVLNSKGIPTEAKFTYEGMNQPDAQSVGTYDALNKQVLFLNLNQIHPYTKKAVVKDPVAIHWGRKKADGVDEEEDLTVENEDHNGTSLIYTGIKGQEIGLLHVLDKTIELYDIKTGFLTKKLLLPDDAITEPTFNFAYANGIYWLFDMENRTWIGYK